MTPPAPTPEEVELDEIATMLDSVGDEYLNWKRQLFPIARKVQEYVRAREATTHARGREEALEEALWAAKVNADESMQSASEAWARCAELVEMLEGGKPVDAEMITKLKEHRAHVIECRKGSCEHEYASLVRAGLVAARARPTPAPCEGERG